MTVAPDVRLGDRYTLLDRIAAGGMGEVWRARDDLLDRAVAVKVLHADGLASPRARERFRAEARHAAALSHPGIAGVHDYGEVGDVSYLVMELVDGEPLSSLLARSGRLPPEQAMNILGQAAMALQAAHEAGVVHRDVKPGNLLLRRDGIVKVTDFGISRAAHEAALTETGVLLGTAQYLAPEQSAGKPAVPASDIYALGVVGYECLAGHPPFSGDSAVAVALSRLHHPPSPLPAHVPAPARTFIDTAMAREPGQRFATAGEMGRQALGLAAGGLRRPTRPMPAARPAAETPTTALAAGAGPAPAPTRRLPNQDETHRRRVRAWFVAAAVAVVLAGFFALLATGTGPGTAQVPNVIGKQRAAALAALQHAGLRGQVVTSHSQRTVGTVLGEDPQPGSRQPTDRPVALTVSSGPAPVNVDQNVYVGKMYAPVHDALTGLGLTVVKRTSPTSNVAADTVLSVLPNGPLHAGDTVYVTVAASPPAPDRHGKGHGDGSDGQGGNGH